MQLSAAPSRQLAALAIPDIDAEFPRQLHPRPQKGLDVGAGCGGAGQRRHIHGWGVRRVAGGGALGGRRRSGRAGQRGAKEGTWVDARGEQCGATEGGEGAEAEGVSRRRRRRR